ncbi:MAG: hypothetical protein SOR40_07685 [Rothia sp. (in: high G+C Gram-positive bacteria)]|nr:hypothetical protein [Rothia sp. (in: high G+C Gram-positive bacteria)]
MTPQDTSPAKDSRPGLSQILSLLAGLLMLTGTLSGLLMLLLKASRGSAPEILSLYPLLALPLAFLALLAVLLLNLGRRRPPAP